MSYYGKTEIQYLPVTVQMSLKNWFSEISEKKIRDSLPVGAKYNYLINWILRKFLETDPEKN